MKPLGFLISILVHLLFFLLIIMVRFPVIELDREPQIIQIVPMSPPLALSQPLLAPAQVYVRPFILKGGARGPGSGKAAGAKADSSRVPFSQGESEPPSSLTRQSGTGKAPAAAPGPGVQDAAGRRTKLTVDLARLSQRLREQNAAAVRPGDAGSGAGDAVEGLPFGDPYAGGEGGGVSPAGDGTSSHALGGNAFFDSRGYDITPWAKRMVYRVKKNWIFPPVSEYGLKGVVGIYMRIGRDGAIGSIQIRKASGIRPFDQAAFNAIELSAPLPPLPDDFPNPDLPAYLLFYYN